MKIANSPSRSKRLANYWKLVLGMACLLLVLSDPAMAQSPDVPWSGQVVCTLSIQSDSYAHQETQTWKLTGEAAKSTGPGGLAIYPTTWSVSGQGSTQRTLAPSRVLASSWKTIVPPMNAPMVIFVRASDKRLVIKTYHAPLYSPNGVIGTRQITSAGVAPAQSNVPSSTGEWILPVIEDSPDNSTVAGSAVTMVGGTAIPERPGGGNEPANCTWNFTKGAASGASAGAGAAGGAASVAAGSANPSGPAGGAASPGNSSGSASGVAGGAAGAAGANNPAAGGAAPVNVVKANPVGGAAGAATGKGASSGGAAGATGTTPVSSASIAGVSPQSVLPGAQNVAVTLTGDRTHFRAGVSKADFGSGVTVTALKVTSATTATAILDVATNAVLGAHDVKITTQDEIADLSAGQTTTKATPTFVVGQKGTPWLPAITPNSVLVGAQNFTVILSGESTHFQQGVSTADFGNGVTIASLTVTSPTSATAVLNVAPTVSPGARYVRVTTLGETAGPSKAEGTPTTSFVVGQLGTPWVSALSPNSVLVGAQNFAVSLTGENTHFQQGVSTVDFGNGVTVASLTVNSPTNATAVLNVAPTVSPGSRSVRVTTLGEAAGPSKGEGSPTTIFAVGGVGTAWLPAITPNSVLPGMQNVSISLTGQSTHFQQGVSTADFGNGVTVTSLHINSPTSATAVLNVATTATIGQRVVRVTTLGEIAGPSMGQDSGTPKTVFVVGATGDPFVQTVSPNRVPPGTQVVSVSLTGKNTHFQQGVSTVDFGNGVTVV